MWIVHVLVYQDMSMNRSRTMGSAWVLWRFAVLPLGSSSTSAADGLLVRERSGDGVSRSPPDQSRICSIKARSQTCCWVGRPRDLECLSGGQLRPTDRAMAARSARTSSSEEDGRSTVNDDHLLTKRCIEKQP